LGLADGNMLNNPGHLEVLYGQMDACETNLNDSIDHDGGAPKIKGVMETS